MLIEPRHIPGVKHTVKVMSDSQETIFEITKSTMSQSLGNARYENQWRHATIELRTMVGGQCAPRELIELAQQAIHEQEKLDRLYPFGQPALE